MTIIVYRDGILACDSQLTAGNLILPGGMEKIRRLKNGTLIGGCGTATGLEAFFEFAKRGFKGKPPKVCKKSDLLVIRPNGLVQAYEGQHKFTFKDKSAYAAYGCGRQIAIGAMWKGATAVEVVEAAIAFDAGCSGAIQQVRL